MNSGPFLPPRAGRVRRALVWVAIMLLALAALTSFVGRRELDAYAHFGAAYRVAPLTPESERLILAQAHADGEAPQGIALSRRIHPPGSLIGLRYEFLDTRGAVYREWQLRVLVPALPGGPADPEWADECYAECIESLAKPNTFRLTGSGNPGIADEWLLRMPIGQPASLGARSLTTQDILEDSPRTLAITSEGTERRPHDVRLTVLSVCPARVRARSETHLRFHEYAIVPIPKSWVTTRWTEVQGCPEPAPLAERTDEPPRIEMQSAVEYPPPAIPEGALTARRGPGGEGVIEVDEQWLARHGTPIKFFVTELCRFDDGGSRWVSLPLTEGRPTILITPLDEGQRRLGNRIAYELPAEPGLYWVRWSEFAEDARYANEGGFRRALVPVGRMLCEDLKIGPAPAGQVAACVPHANHALATFVPEPKPRCDEQLRAAP